MFSLIVPLLLGAAQAQQVGYLTREIHPKLQWSKCTASGGCSKVSGGVVVDAEWRWLHNVGGFHNCFIGNEWVSDTCNSSANCTTNCALEGAEYKSTFGVETNKDNVALRFKTSSAFAQNVNNRVFLLESDTKYQTFTLLNNEFAFDVDLSAVPCGLNSRLQFLAMDADGGVARWPSNKAGAAYGTGYCDATCTRGLKFLISGNKANYDGWTPSLWDARGGQGLEGACCSEFDLWSSNAHSYSTTSKLCLHDGYAACLGDNCGDEYYDRTAPCDRTGCDFNPFRLGATDFYGIGKKVDTRKKFTVVTQFHETEVTQYFVQGGKRFEAPSPVLPGFPEGNGLSGDYCDRRAESFGEPDKFKKFGGWGRHNDVLSQPLVLAISLSNDYWSHNLWLDSAYPVDADPHRPGVVRGDCPAGDHEPWVLEQLYPEAKAAWSNIRFGPIGSILA
ncbi:glycosyl hydrolase family 7 [Paramyrothecium foliicola]|nr:glycosyl hydrolase family 7 [Paramyrothecium foliicola]